MGSHRAGLPYIPLVLCVGGWGGNVENEQRSKAEKEEVVVVVSLNGGVGWVGSF